METCVLRENNTLQETKQHERERQPPTLKLAGAGYSLGDLMMMVAGIARHGSERALGTISGGALWLAGGLAAARYGNPSTEKKLAIHASKLQEYLQQRGISIPEDARAKSDLLQHRSLWQKVEEYCYEHPSELLNAAYSIGAGMLLADGVKEVKRGTATLLPKTLNLKGIEGMSSKLWIGLVVITGALIGLLVKEDPKAKEHAKEEGVAAKLWAQVKEKPLRISGALYTVNNAFLGLQAWQDYQKRNTVYAGKQFKPHYASTVQLASYLMSNFMLMQSHRDQMAGDTLSAEALERLENAATRIIAAQPAQVREPLLEDIAHQLASQKGMGVDAHTLKAQLKQKLAAVEHHPVQQAPRPSFTETLHAAREAASITADTHRVL